MSWSLSGLLIDCCSCNMACPCAFGAGDPHRGWCSGSLTSDIHEGSSEGVSLSGTRVIWAVDRPKDFASGNGTARLYIGDSATPQQQGELESIFQGKKGGPWRVIVEGVVSKWLPTRVIPIKIRAGNGIEISAGDVGCIQLASMMTLAGDEVKVLNPPGFVPFNINEIQLAYNGGSDWCDPEMRHWKGAPQGWGSVARSTGAHEAWKNVTFASP